MEVEFWLDAWETTDKPGFHQADYNPTMQSFFNDQELVNKTVFIPMAGKTLDINYFIEQGAHVVAIECSKKAINEYFLENKIDFESTVQGPYNIYKAGKLTYIEGDYFNLTKSLIGHIDYVYDRASVVAMPREMRTLYIDKIAELTNKETTYCILTFECDLDVTIGPPFMIPAKELETSYKDHNINLKHKVVNTTVSPKKYADKGVKELRNVLWTNA